MSSSEQKVINDLADEDLANIFKQLPPHERLLISEVNKRWYGISRIPWRDVRHLDLTPIPGESIGPIVKQCPNLRTVFAKDRTFSANQLHTLASAELSSVKLYSCSRAVPRLDFNLFSELFSDNLRSAAWKDLVLCDFGFTISHNTFRYSVNACSLPASLERLQFTCVDFVFPLPDDTLCVPRQCLAVSHLQHLNHLTCLSVQCSGKYNAEDGWCDADTTLFCALEALETKTLRELCIGGNERQLLWHHGSLSLDLPRLEVLFLNTFCFPRGKDHLQDLATKHPALRILCITGSFAEECTIPIRRLYPNGFGSDPVPKLHVFVGKQASEKIIFTRSPADALEIHPITEPLPEFLAKEEIAPLFEGVWLAAQIKEGAKHGSSWWKYEGDTATSYRTADDA